MMIVLSFIAYGIMLRGYAKGSEESPQGPPHSSVIIRNGDTGRRLPLVGLDNLHLCTELSMRGSPTSAHG